MTFDDFERASHEAFEEIPEEYREGIAGLRVLPEVHSHPSLPDVFTMGECVTEAYPSSFDGPETVQSVIILYHGSFGRIAARDPEFEWMEQIWETLVHELQHHLESLAGEDDLEEVDYAMNEDFKRSQGERFDPWYYQYGHDLGGGAYDVEGRYFLEIEWKPDARPKSIDFEWEDRRFRVPFPAEPGDVHFVEIWRLPDDAAVDLVLLKRQGMRSKLRRALKRDRVSVTQSRADGVHLG